MLQILLSVYSKFLYFEHCHKVLHCGLVKLNLSKYLPKTYNFTSSWPPTILFHKHKFQNYPELWNLLFPQYISILKCFLQSKLNTAMSESLMLGKTFWYNIAHKCKPTSSRAELRKQQCISSCEEKLAALDLLRDGISTSHVATSYNAFQTFLDLASASLKPPNSPPLATCIYPPTIRLSLHPIVLLHHSFMCYPAWEIFSLPQVTPPHTYILPLKLSSDITFSNKLPLTFWAKRINHFSILPLCPEPLINMWIPLCYKDSFTSSPFL